jgi:hypothetical protein
MSWERVFKNLAGGAFVAGVCFLLYKLFGFMFAVFGVFVAVFMVFDRLSDGE